MSERGLLEKALEALRPFATLDLKGDARSYLLTTEHQLRHRPFNRARAVHAEIKAALDSDAADGWQGISTAPKDRKTLVDLWVAWNRGEAASRVADCFWCDLDYCRGWMEQATGRMVTGDKYSSGEPTHWRPTPAPPTAAPAREQNPSNDMASDKRCPYGSREG